MRLFIGIPLALEMIDALERLAQRLCSADDGLRWNSPESRHITLQFLGETSDKTCECLVARLKAVKSPGVPVLIDGTDFFDRAGVFYASVNVSPPLLQLEERVLAATSQCGFIGEHRPFHPHVTLARAKGDKRMQTLRRLKAQVNPDMRFPAFTAKEFLLYQAFLGPGGSRYEVRERFLLGESNA